jgi:glycosyltransferase involved in cell wall biosynthesis
VRVAFFPNSWRRQNPYLNLLEGGLHEVGVHVCPVDVDRPFRWWLKRHLGTIDVLHFHWLHPMYQRHTFRESLIRVLKLGAQLICARRLGYRVVWTMHNIYPHERRNPTLDRWVRLLILAWANAVVVHCRAAEAALEKEFSRRRHVYVAQLGSYAGIYPDTVSRSEARRQLGLADHLTVFLTLGMIRPYKGLPHLIRSFRGVQNPNATLVVAGRAPDTDYLQSSGIAQVHTTDPRVLLRIGWVADSEMQVYHRACDVAVFPFSNVLTSSSVMLALSFGRPVVAPASGCLPELVDPSIGVLYDPSERTGLRDALIRCTEMALDTMGERAYEVATSYSWRETAVAVRAAYEGRD